MTATEATGQKLDIGRVITQLFTVLGRNLVTFLILAVLLAGLPTAAVGYLQVQAFPFEGDPTLFSAGTALLTGLMGLLSFVFGLVLQGAITHGAVVYLNGRRPSVTACLATGLRYFFWLLLIGILFGLAVAFGLVLLIVPGIMIACAWCVAVPAEVAENTGVFGAFSRSADLTRGSRWRIFVLFVVYVVIAMAIQSVVMALMVGPIMAAGGAAVAATREALTLQAVFITPVVSILNSVIGAVGGAVLYMELRRTKEGLGAESLADVFA